VGGNERRLRPECSKASRQDAKAFWPVAQARRRRTRQQAGILVTASELQPLTDRPERFMVIVAHPDDADFGPAATVARWIEEGSVGDLVC
jgi:hypothetical protein